MANRTYEDAIDALNTLQTRFETLETRRQAGVKIGELANEKLRAYLHRIGHSARDLDRLNVVHVAGTKGKGSVCAYVNSIYAFYRQSHGIPKKTGLFTSPHLVSVRERIQINSTPISASMFAKYFWEVWDLLEASEKADSSRPTEKPVYFRYLTLMSFHIFLKEGVDAAVYEVGVGGEYDSTNIVERPAVTGISTMGIDHVHTLGDTIEKITWHKAGIMKQGSPAFSVTQVPDATKVIADRAVEKGVNCSVVGLDPRLKNVKIHPDALFQRTNASLAVALASTALKKIDSSFSLPDDSLPKEFIDGLEKVVWRGRCETKVEGKIRWCLDGAHTADSLKIAGQWFGNESAFIPGLKVLIFNQQGRPEAVELLEGLLKGFIAQGLRFDHAIFCTNLTSAEKEYKRDFVNRTYDPSAIANLTIQKQFAEKWSSLDPQTTILVTASIEEALDHVKALSKNAGNGSEQAVQALITGSLHLVGGALGILEGADAL